jgi:hypothetical protein
MPHTCYIPKKFTKAHQEIIDKADEICAEYASSGLQLTLRQLYYQFVARGLIANRQSEYKRLGDILNDARWAGQLDWDYLIDRGRNLVGLSHWEDPSKVVERAAETFHTDLWAPQGRRVEVWVEKDAAIGVIENVCQANDVPYFSCRGYTSASEMWKAGNRLRFHIESGEQVTVLHIGDHDPSGLDMTRDITDRLRTVIHTDWAKMHMGPGRWSRGQIKASMREAMRAKGSKIEDRETPWEVRRIALTREQIETYDPPPNPAKQTDSRFAAYMEETGLDESWELDALDPYVMQDLIQDHVDGLKDEGKWSVATAEMETGRATLKNVARNWTRIAEVHKPQEDR